MAVAGLSVMFCDKLGEYVTMGNVLANPVVVTHLRRVLECALPVIRLTFSLHLYDFHVRSHFVPNLEMWLSVINFWPTPWHKVLAMLCLTLLAAISYFLQLKLLKESCLAHSQTTKESSPNKTLKTRLVFVPRAFLFYI
jgi:hypothetical protein